MYLVLGYFTFIKQIVGTYHRPLDYSVIVTDLCTQIFRRFLVVHMWRQYQTKKPDNALLGKRNPLGKIAVAITSSVHEHKPDSVIGIVCFDGLAQSAGRIGHKPARVAVNAFKIHVVPQARRDSITAFDMPSYLIVAESQNTCMDHEQVIVIPDVFGQLIRRPYNDSDLYTAI